MEQSISNKIKTMYNEGYNATEIAGELGMTMKKVISIGRLMGLDWKRSVYRDGMLEEIEKLVKKGLSAREIAEKIGSSRQCVRSVCVYYGIKTPAVKNYRRWSPELTESIAKRIVRGDSMKEIASDMNVCISALYYAINRRGYSIKELRGKKDGIKKH